MELIVTARSPILGQLILLQGMGQVQMNGAFQVVYAVLDRSVSSGGRNWRLTTDLYKSDVNVDCTDCHNLNVQLVLQVRCECGENRITSWFNGCSIT